MGDNMKIEFKKAKNCDLDLLFEWTNDKYVRQNAFNKDAIKYEDHMMWFRNKINSLDTYMFICYLDDNPVGQVRIDNQEGLGIISYSVEKGYRGMGLGSCILENINKVIKENNIKLEKLIGKVIYSNEISQKIFKKAGFMELKREKYIEYVKKI